jgi:branched-chain amino acid transport system substrate-binding protein
MIQGNRRPRRTARLLLVVVAVALAAAACAPEEDSGGQAGGTEKLGFISPVTGFVAALGTDMRRGWEMYWSQNGGKAGDTTVQTVFEDDTGDPDVALTKARRLVEQEQVQLVAGPILANTAYAVAGYVAGKGLPTVQMTGADDLTQRKFDPLVLRVGYTSSQSNFPAGQWAYDKGHRKAVTICPDYAFGWESCGGFVSAFVKAGGKITKAPRTSAPTSPRPARPTPTWCSSARPAAPTRSCSTSPGPASG